MKKVEHLVDNVSLASPTIPHEFPSSVLKGGKPMSPPSTPQAPQQGSKISSSIAKRSTKAATSSTTTRSSFWPFRWLFTTKTPAASNPTKKLPSSASLVMVKSLSESLKVTCSSPPAETCDKVNRGSAHRPLTSSQRATFRQSFSFNDVDSFAERYNSELLDIQSKDPQLSLSPSLSSSSTKLSSTATSSSSSSATNKANYSPDSSIRIERQLSALEKPYHGIESHYKSNIGIIHSQRKSSSFRNVRTSKKDNYYEGKPGQLTKRQICKLCWIRKPVTDMHALWKCGCCFCRDCLRVYLEINIKEGNLSALTCPDADCPELGSSKTKPSIEKVLASQEIALLVSPSIYQMYKRYRMNWLVEQDPYRVWCPTPNCETICTISRQYNFTKSSSSSSKKYKEKTNNALPVFCNTCKVHFCATCKRKLSNTDSHFCNDESASKWNSIAHELSLDPELEENIKRCPRCYILIERDEGCAQMMCRSCKHVFCWFCLSSLEDDFLLRHYDRGPCKNKLGHSRASVIWHRTQVIGVFAGFGLLLLLASPMFLLAAPCLLCCRCGNSCRYEENADDNSSFRSSRSSSRNESDPFADISSAASHGEREGLSTSPSTSKTQPSSQAPSSRASFITIPAAKNPIGEMV